MGEGSTFRVRVMLSTVERPVAAARKVRRITGYRGPRLTILVTDDEPSHRQCMAEFLRPIGFDVLVADGGEACLALAQSHSVQAFLLDIAMPGMDGWTLARTLRQGRYEHTPIVMVSANAFEGLAERHPGSLHDDFIVKPVAYEQLVEKLGHLLHLDWVFEGDGGGEGEAAPAASVLPAAPPAPADSPPADSLATDSRTPEEGTDPVPLTRELIDTLWTLGTMGYVRGINDQLDAMMDAGGAQRSLAERLRPAVRDFKLGQYMRAIGELREPAD
jgi:CheY-like chemotaxis protein